MTPPIELPDDRRLGPPPGWLVLLAAFVLGAGVGNFYGRLLHPFGLLTGTLLAFVVFGWRILAPRR